MLTQNQETIIQSLRDEFLKINEPLKAPADTLFDCNGLIEATLRKQARIEEVKAINQAAKQVSKGRGRADAERLSKMLAPLNITAKYEEKNNGSIAVKIHFIGKPHSNEYNINVYYCYASQLDELSQMMVATKQLIRCYLTPTQDFSFETLEELCAHKLFKEKITKLYQSNTLK